MGLDDALVRCPWIGGLGLPFLTPCSDRRAQTSVGTQTSVDWSGNDDGAAVGCGRGWCGVDGALPRSPCAGGVKRQWSWFCAGWEACGITQDTAPGQTWSKLKGIVQTRCRAGRSVGYNRGSHRGGLVWGEAETLWVFSAPPCGIPPSCPVPCVLCWSVIRRQAAHGAFFAPISRPAARSCLIIMRWSVESPSQRPGPSGLETQRQWADQTIAAPPVLCPVFARHRHGPANSQGGSLPWRHTAWYHNASRLCGRLALVVDIMAARYFVNSASGGKSMLAAEAFELLLTAFPLAANWPK